MCREGLTVVTLLHWHMHLAIQLANLVNVQTVDLFHVWSLSHGSWYCNSIDQDSLGAAAHLGTRGAPESVASCRYRGAARGRASPRTGSRRCAGSPRVSASDRRGCRRSSARGRPARPCAYPALPAGST